ncbi:glycosyltransferase family 2 protein [Pelagicoccus mobilis]|uniref:Glycosyltransferase family 2 protein n=1 Tax=Pelagicoccus mobilis TaxID=415221 RepID=A0A934RZ44_9BACT|nr:glycosyltransferase family 2 protein [Pelagicoccus mobilis]MBK1877949.1 glycosyltransferase family 2 protein [Pelagicoccus mobilis]
MKNTEYTERTPRVSIGLPVYNGSNYIRQAIDSILEQTYRDFEIIICDNASTDDTQAICEEYVKRDKRVVYHRNSSNIGAGRNYNLVVEYARGEFFKWAAHDDICHPELLEKSVERLDAEPDVVLVYSKARQIDENTNYGDSYSGSDNTALLNPVQRFRELVRPHICFQVFGLMRLDVLKDTPMIGLYARGDEILLCWLGLRGRFARIDEHLFFPRKHEEQSMAMLADKKKKKKADLVAYSVWFDPKWRNKIVLPWWISLRELIRCVVKAPISFRDKIGCFGVIMRWVCTRRRSLARDLYNQMQHFTLAFSSRKQVRHS